MKATFLSAASLLDPADGTFAPLDEARRAHEAAGATPDKHVVACCPVEVSWKAGRESTLGA